MRAAISGIPSAYHHRSVPTGYFCLKVPLTAFPLSNCSAWKTRYGSRTITCPYRAYTGCGAAKQLLPLDNLRHVMLRGVIFEHRCTAAIKKRAKQYARLLWSAAILCSQTAHLLYYVKLCNLIPWRHRFPVPPAKRFHIGLANEYLGRSTCAMYLLSLTLNRQAHCTYPIFLL